MRGYAERAVWLTHFLNDPGQINAIKSEILADNSDEISVEELDAFLESHINDLPLHGASEQQRGEMINGMQNPQSVHTQTIEPGL